MDREKVIKGIDICLQRFRCGEDCPYYNYEKIGCMEQLQDDALELLKEQEEEIQSLRRENHDILTQFHEWAKEQQQIVRCKDCKRHIKPGDCDYGNKPDDWFCAEGERN